MNNKSIVKQVLTVFAASVVLAAGAAHAADRATPLNQLNQTDGSSQVVAATAIKSAPVAASNGAAATPEKVRESVDVNSPSFRKFIDDVAQRSGG
jgi:opacity protein-like surface antigen